MAHTPIAFYHTFYPASAFQFTSDSEYSKLLTEKLPILTTPTTSLLLSFDDNISLLQDSAYAAQILISLANDLLSTLSHRLSIIESQNENETAIKTFTANIRSTMQKTTHAVLGLRAIERGLQEKCDSLLEREGEVDPMTRGWKWERVYEYFAGFLEEVEVKGGYGGFEF
ncbi:MAG: hypothetical protein Q9209_005594 [Squamulea sp. 1 TL-2023]